MPVMNFDLEDGKPPVSFTLKPDDCARFVAFMKECDASLADAARYRWLRSIGHDQLNAAMHYGLEALDKFVDEARGVRVPAVSLPITVERWPDLPDGVKEDGNG